MQKNTRALSFLRRPFKYTYKNAALALICANALCYLLSRVFPQILSYCSLNILLVLKGNMYWQLFTYQFMHANFEHLFMNMLALFFFGVPFERTVGTKEFLLYYLLAGFFCGLVSFGIFYGAAMANYLPAYYMRLLGASGAVYAVLLAFAVTNPRSTIFVFGIIPVPAPILVILYTVIELASQVFGVKSGVAHYAHLAGFAFGFIYFLVRMRINPWRVWFPK